VLEVISPNVSYIIALGLEPENTVYEITMHPKGIIEINTLDRDEENGEALLSTVMEDFKQYEEAGHLYPVSVTGLKTLIDQTTGSVRFCAWDGLFAEALTNIIKTAEVPELVQMDGELWQFAEVSKYFRFMRYEKGGEHFPHYDSDFEVFQFPGTLGAKTLYATKYSLVMYFNDCESGEIAFIEHDGKDKSDWARQATDYEIFLKILPKAGKIVLFPHDVCHTVLPYTDDDERYIVRGDLIFTKVGY
jgi:hypothetical protein